MPYFPNPSGGAPIQADTNPNPAGGSYGLYSAPGYSGPPPPTGGGSGSTAPATAGPAASTSSQSAAQVAAGVNQLLAAAATGNKAALDETAREFNQTFSLDTQKQKDLVDQFNQNLAVSAAGLTGTYQGQQTQAAQLQAYNEAVGTAGLTGYYVAPGTGVGGAAGTPGTLSWNQVSQQLQPVAGAAYNDAAAKAAYAQSLGLNPASFNGSQAAPLNQAQLNAIYAAGGAPAGTAPSTQQGQMTTAYQNQIFTQQMAAINAAAALQANPFRQAQVIGQAGRVLQGLPTAGFSAPNTVAGVGTAGGNTQGGMGYMQQLIDDIKDPTANQTTAQSWLDNTPSPNKLDSVSFLQSSPTTQNLILQSMQEKYGLDPTDSMAQIKATMPQAFAAPNTLGTVRRG